MPPPPDSALRFQPLAVLRSILAIIVGYVVFAGGLMGAVLLAWGGLVEGPSAALVPISMVGMLLSIVLGGAVAGVLAGRRPGGHGLAVGAIALIVLVVGTFASNALEPDWYRIVGAVVSLPLAYLGSELAGKKVGAR
ncbi:MAG: hypothetical protein JJ896_06170 [Rhodothermales bacterium]|nr:hypothetical protein [Rhodothermales bacterium]MBO6779219.1 hypothetical protein [Rhodothermales bacterium]